MPLSEPLGKDLWNATRAPSGDQAALRMLPFGPAFPLA